MQWFPTTPSQNVNNWKFRSWEASPMQWSWSTVVSAFNRDSLYFVEIIERYRLVSLSCDMKHIESMTISNLEIRSEINKDFRHLNISSEAGVVESSELIFESLSIYPFPHSFLLLLLRQWFKERISVLNYSAKSSDFIFKSTNMEKRKSFHWLE
jgi:hypothetical protein